MYTSLNIYKFVYTYLIFIYLLLLFTQDIFQNKQELKKIGTELKEVSIISYCNSQKIKMRTERFLFIYTDEINKYKE